MRNRGFTLVELLFMVGLFALLAALLMPALGRARESARRASCQMNLKQFGLIFGMYAAENPGGKYPPLQFHIRGDEFSFAAAPRIDSIYPDYLVDPAILLCPSDMTDSAAEMQDAAGIWLVDKPDYDGGKASMADASYAYWGWVFDKVDDDDEAAPVGSSLSNLLGVPAEALGPLQMVSGYNWLAGQIERAGSVRPVDDDMRSLQQGMGNGGTDNIYRLRSGIERFLITDINNPNAAMIAQSRIWVMHDSISTEPRDFNHLPGGANVLYMDGHIEFIRYPGAAPINPLMASMVRGIWNPEN